MSRPTDWHEVFGFGDPTPGDPWEVRDAARRWDDVSDMAEYAESKLRGLLGDGAVVSWVGQAGNRFREHSSDLPGQLDKVTKSYRLASSAMTWWAGRLAHHQGVADLQLAHGREARHDLTLARSRFEVASDSVRSAQSLPGFTATAPDPDQVQHATATLDAAQSAQRSAQGLVDNAQARLDAARMLAEDAGEARAADGRQAAHRIREAADAGLAPRSRWQRIKDGVSKVWDAVVTIAKIVVAVLGVVVLIIGGPLAWVVLAAALVLLVDSLIKYANGEGSLLDVGLALLGCIPGTKGLTTLAELSAAFRAGGMLGAVAHVGGALKGAAVALAQTANVLRKGFVPGVQAAIHILGQEGALAIPQLRSTIADIGHAFIAVDNQAVGMVTKAREWQGSVPFPGIDDYRNVMVGAGSKLEAGFPGISNYAAPAGNAAAHGHSAQAVWEGLQVGPNLHDYRPSVIELHVNQPVPAATGTTLANPQYGAGGTQQYFLDIREGLSAGHISVHDVHGSPIDLTGVHPGDINSALHQLDQQGSLAKINLHGADNPSPHVSYQDEVTHHPGQFRAPDLGQLNIDVNLQHSLHAITQVLQGSGYIGDVR